MSLPSLHVLEAFWCGVWVNSNVCVGDIVIVFLAFWQYCLLPRWSLSVSVVFVSQRGLEGWWYTRKRSCRKQCVIMTSFRSDDLRTPKKESNDNICHMSQYYLFNLIKKLTQYNWLRYNEQNVIWSMVRTTTTTTTAAKQ